MFDIEKKRCYYNNRKGATDDGSPDRKKMVKITALSFLG